MKHNRFFYNRCATKWCLRKSLWFHHLCEEHKLERDFKPEYLAALQKVLEEARKHPVDIDLRLRP